MMASRTRLIADLTHDLAPVRHAGRTGWVTIAWLAGATLFSILVLLIDGPFRHGCLEQLAESRQFLLEGLLGIATIAALARVGIRLAIPSVGPLWRQVCVPLALLAAWIGLYLYGFHSPALTPSMAGKRPFCVFEAALVGLPALACGLLLARRLWPLHGAWTGLMIGLAAGAIPALLMQFACMYAPAHIFIFHLLPGLSLGAVGAACGAWFLREP